MISCEKTNTKFKIMKTPLEKLLGIITLKVKENAIYLIPIIDKIDVDNYKREEQLIIDGVINWVACKDTKPIDGREYLISDGEDVTEAQWYDDSKWGGMPYDDYTHFVEKPKPPA